jgi:hypothetical protein
MFRSMTQCKTSSTDLSSPLNQEKNVRFDSSQRRRARTCTSKLLSRSFQAFLAQKTRADLFCLTSPDMQTVSEQISTTCTHALNMNSNVSHGIHNTWWNCIAGDQTRAASTLHNLATRMSPKCKTGSSRFFWETTAREYFASSDAK